MSLLFWKKKHTGEVIAHSCYDKLPAHHKAVYERTSTKPTHEVDNSGSFGLSLLVGMETGNPMLGALAGGDFGGAMVGSMLHSENISNTDTVPDGPNYDFGGGSGDGAGASGSWDSGSSDNSSNDSSSSYDSSSSDSSSSDSSSSGSDN